VPRILDSKVERELREILEEAVNSYRENPDNEYRMGRVHMIADVLNRLQSVEYYYKLDRDKALI
jgi:hypothetical protein